jgi:hypothetical protein
MMKVRLRREEQAEVIRAIESVRVYEEFIEDTMQNRAREATTRQNSTELEERRKKIMASIVISVNTNSFYLCYMTRRDFQNIINILLSVL